MVKPCLRLLGREPRIFWLLWCLYIFHSSSSRASSNILSFIICRSHTSILSWFKSLSFLFTDKSNCRVRVLLIDDTRIRIGSREKILYIAFEPYLRRIVYMMAFDSANILTSLIFIKRIKAIYGSK